jgi:hypothetical protein
MKNAIIFFIVICAFCNLNAQHHVYQNFSLHDPEKETIAQLINEYINGRLKSEQVFVDYDIKTFKSIDIAKEALSLGGTLYNITFDANILSIKKEGDNYMVQVMFYWHNPETTNRTISVLGIMDFWVRKENNNWKISNYLNYYSRQWSTTTVGNFKFIYYPEFPFDNHKAKKAVDFYNGLNDFFGISQTEFLTYFIAQNCDDIYKLSGFEYFISEGNDNNLCAIYDEKNSIIYTNPSKGEMHLHEIIHTLNKHFPTCNDMLKIGLSCYINNAGSRGNDAMYHVKRFIDYAEINNVDFENFENLENVDEYTNISYVIGPTLCNAIYRKGGKELLLDFMNNTKDMTVFKSKLKKEFKIKDFKTFFKEEMSIYINQNKSLINIE